MPDQTIRRVILAAFLAALFAGPATGVRAAAIDAMPALIAPPLDSLMIAPDLASELAKFQRVRMPFDSTTLSARERRMVDKLVEACRYIDQIFWQQSDPQGWQLYRQLRADQSIAGRNLRRFLRINGGRYELIHDDAPFVGITPAPPGRDLYPADLTQAEFERYLGTHPEQKAALYDPHSIVRRQWSLLAAIPYHVVYRQWLEPMAALLRDAAALADDAAFANFLRLRADALLSDDYLPSNLAWLDLEHPKVDLIFGPDESYMDGLLGIRTSYEAAVLVRDDVESRKLDVYEQYIAQIQDALPLAAEDRPSKQGLRSPMEVMDAPYRAGDLRHGYQAVADNLPNEPLIHEQRGSKKIIFKNFMDARVSYVILPIARRLLRSDQAAQVSAEGYLAASVLHEIAHDLGPAYARVGGSRQEIRAAIGADFSGLEEAKADIVGLFGLKWLADHGAIPPAKLNGYYVSYVAGIFRTVRFGAVEAHGRAQMMEFNYLSAGGVLARDPATGRYAIDLARMPHAVADLATELLQQEASGDRARTQAWFTRYGAMPHELAQALEAVHAVPVDIDPVSDFAED
jgi:hypothetical protein